MACSHDIWQIQYKQLVIIEMSISASGLILNVPRDRRALLLDESGLGSSYNEPLPFVAEPVPNFRHSSRAPLVVFASFEDERITHIAEGKRSIRAGTGLVRLNLYDLTPLSRSIEFNEITRGVPARVRHNLQRVISAGGILPQKTLEAFIDRIMNLDETVAGRLARYTAHQREALNPFTPNENLNLALQKESLGLALEIAGISRDELWAWRPRAVYSNPF